MTEKGYARYRKLPLVAPPRRARDDVWLDEPIAIGESMRRAGVLSPASFDAAEMTVVAVLSSFADVRRAGFVERLDPAGMDGSRLIGAPVLDSHRTGSSRDVLGTVTAVRVEDGRLVGVIRLSMAEDVAPAIQKIREGVLRGVSLGYRVSRWEDSIENGVRVRTAAAWIPLEVSAVAVPADPASVFRSNTMPDIEEIEVTPTDGAEAAKVRALAELARKPTAWAEEVITRGLTVEDARALIHAEAMEAAKVAPRIRVASPAGEDPSVITRRMGEAMAVRMAGGDAAPEVRQYLNLSTLDMARRSLEAAGQSTRTLSVDEMLMRAMTASDFPTLVSNAMGKVAADAYQAAESPLKVLFKKRTLPNFKTSTSIRLGGMGRLEEITESGEIRHTSRAESGETMSLGTYARGISVSRKLLIDDDLNLLGDMTSALGTAAAQTESDLIVETITGNPKMTDGVTVFHASRGNVGTASTISVAALNAARKAMRGRTDLDGTTLINVQPKYLVVGPEMEAWAEQVLAEIYPSTSENVNPFSGKFQLLVEPRITDYSWFVFADPARTPALQFAYLSSAPGVQIQRAEEWDVLGSKWRAFLDFGCGWLDWRPAQFNAGEA